MAIHSMSIPPAFATGQVVGRHNVGLLIRNDEYLRGVAERWKSYPYGRITGAPLPTNTGTAFTGYHWYNSDADLFHYTIGGTADALGDLDLTLTYDGTTIWTDTVNAGATEVFNGTVALSGVGGISITDGNPYPVVLTWDGNGVRDAHSYWYRPFFTSYVGSGGALTYTAPHVIADGHPSVAADEYAAWRNNDLFFQACLPANFPTLAEVYGFPAAGTSIDTHYYLPERFHRIHYKIKAESTVALTTVSLIYALGDANETTETIDATSPATTYEDFFDCNMVDFNEGDSRMLVLRLTSGAGGQNGSATIYYICNGPDTTEVLAEPYTIMTEPAVGAYVYGNTTDARFSRLNDNDDYLHYAYSVDEDVLVAGSAHGFYGRQDFVVPGTGNSYGFIRQGDTLYYQAVGASIYYGSGSSYALPSTAEGAEQYATVDLNNVSGLGYGMAYMVTKGAGNLNFAMEV